MVATEELSDISSDNGYDIESQRPPSNVIVVIVKLSDFSICVKTCIVFLFAALLAPLLICDVWFAASDNFCMNRRNPHLEIVMRELLMVSGLINVGGLAVISIFVCLHNEGRPMTRRVKYCVHFMRNMTVRAFTMTWLVLSGIIMDYADSADCREEAIDYLCCRFVFGMIGNILICLWR
jgi:hypothetical protein